MAEGAGVGADLVSRAGLGGGARARRRPAWSISPAAVAKEPATAGCRLARRSRSGSLPECHRVGRGSTGRVRITGRGTTTAGKLDWLLWSESFMPSIKPPEGDPGNCRCRPTLGEPPTRPLAQADRVPDVIAVFPRRARAAGLSAGSSGGELRAIAVRVLGEARRVPARLPGRRASATPVLRPLGRHRVGPAGETPR